MQDEQHGIFFISYFHLNVNPKYPVLIFFFVSCFHKIYLKMNTGSREKFFINTDSDIKKKRGLYHRRAGSFQVLGSSCQELQHKIPCSAAVHRGKWKERNLSSFKIYPTG